MDMKTFVDGQLRPSNEDEPAKKQRFPVNSSSKLRERPGHYGTHSHDRVNDLNLSAAPSTKVKQEPGRQAEVHKLQHHGPFDTDTESIGDTVTDPSIFNGDDHQQLSRQGMRQPQSVVAQDFNEVNRYSDIRLKDAQELRQVYPHEFESDEQALDAIEKSHVMRGYDGQFMWIGGAGSYPTTTSGVWEEDEDMERADMNNDHYQQPHGEFQSDDEMQRPNVSPHVLRAQIPNQDPLAERKISNAPNHSIQNKEFDINHRQEDVYEQVRHQAGAPLRIPPRATRPASPQMLAKTADRLTPGSTPTKKTSNAKQLRSQAHEPYADVHTRAHEHDHLELDFNPPDLWGKKYEDLQRMAFDDDPHPIDTILSEPDQHKSLTERLIRVGTLSPDQQAAFFTSLDIHDWEDAGDWFIDQFSQLLQGLKAARSDKRKLAIAFEAEIEARHLAVSRRRNVVDDALKGMRASGAAVLQGTPNKNTKF